MIITVCRTRNEERNIERFCTEYSKISDRIMICDGGSEDETIDLAKKFGKVTVVPYKERAIRKDVWRNPHGKHMNFMFDWAKSEGASWIIFDDCDSVPNKQMKEAAPEAFANPDYHMVKIQRVYLYKTTLYFPKMSNAGFGIWAWRSHVNVRASEDDPWVHHMEIPKEAPFIILQKPNALLHYSFPDDEEIQRKKEFYQKAKNLSDWNPLHFGGDLATIEEEWMVP